MACALTTGFTRTPPQLIGGLGDVERTENLRLQREEIVRRWNASGLLEGLNDGTRQNIAQLMESQASHLLNETRQQETEGNWENIQLPIVRRLFSRLASTDIVTPKKGLVINNIKKHKL